jgi:hypothetical protein
MRIWCTVLRKDGTYKTVSVKAGKKDFELDKQKYNIKSFRIGSMFGIRILRAVYHEGLPDPLEFDIDKELKKANLKIDSKTIKNVTNKKILDVFGEAEFTRLEMLVIIMTICTLAVSAINLVVNILVIHKMGVL